MNKNRKKGMNRMWIHQTLIISKEREHINK